MSEIRKIQWHPAFCSAIRLELREDKEFLEYFNEYNLNTKPLQIDLLIIKKLCKTELRNEIGKENQKWLTLLNTDLGQDDVQRFVEQNNRLHQKEEKELADSVLQVAMMGNREVFEETKKEGDYMCEALRELFSDEIEAEKARARREGREEGIAEGRAEGRVEGLAAGMAEGRAEERAESQNVISKLQEQIELLNQTVVELKNKLSKLEEA